MTNANAVALLAVVIFASAAIVSAGGRGKYEVVAQLGGAVLILDTRTGEVCASVYISVDPTYDRNSTRDALRKSRVRICDEETPKASE